MRNQNMCQRCGKINLRAEFEWCKHCEGTGYMKNTVSKMKTKCHHCIDGLVSTGRQISCRCNCKG